MEQERLVEENVWLHEMVDVTVKTKDDHGFYTTEIKECVCELLTHNVSTANVSKVIEAVLKLDKKRPVIFQVSPLSKTGI